MKKIEINKIVIVPLLLIALALAFTSCQKDSDGKPVVKAGNPVLESVTPAAAQGGVLVVIKGTGLGDMQNVYFDKDSIPAYLMSTLNTETAILIRVPANAEGGNQNIILINSKGDKLTVPFNVLAYPIVYSVDNYDFVEGSQITITGTNLNDVSSVKLHGTSDAATIVSKTKQTLVIAMPATSVYRATLDIINVTGLTTTTQEFVSITNNFVIFTDDYGPGAFNGGVQNWSYGTNSVGPATDEFKTGTKSLKVSYQANGGLSLFLGSDTWADGHWFTDFFTPVYLTFWAKAVGYDVDIKLVDDSPPWSGSFPTGTKTVTVPKDVWTYFKISASIWPGPFGRFDIINTATADRTIYFDDLMFVK